MQYPSRRSHCSPGAKPRSTRITVRVWREAELSYLRPSGRLSRVTRERWLGTPPEAELGAVVHGPLVLARTSGIAVGLRCVFAHPTGLHVPLVVLARAIHAEAAGRQTGHQPAPSGYRPSDPPGWSQLELVGQVNGRTGEMSPFSATRSSSLDRYTEQAEYWIGELPRDGVLRLTVAWPRLGLASATTTLRLDPPDRIAAGAVTLLPP